MIFLINSVRSKKVEERMYSREALGAIVKFIRKKKLNIRQDQLSKALDISQSAISKIENGSLEMGAPTLLNFFNLYDISPNEFKDLADAICKEKQKSKKTDVSFDYNQVLTQHSKQS